ncbi:MAG: ATP-binding cassette domain-containing protein [Bacilli bacterium]
MDILLQTDKVNKVYKNTRALKNVSMTIYRGDIYGFIGENGAGKSTMIRVITGVNKPTSGHFTLNISKRLGAMAAIVESPALHNGLNAMNNLRVQCDLLNLQKTDAELLDLLAHVGLEDQQFSKKAAKNFSLGMKQRLSIALALLGNPEFILLDEPMNGLDPVGIKDMRELILKLNRENGTTFLISSHILNELDKVATKYGFISHGELIEEISNRELHAKAKSVTKIVLLNPLSAEVTALLSSYRYEVKDEKTLLVNDEKDGQKVFQLLMGNGVEVSSFDVERESIEDYYLKTVKKGVRA